MDDWQKALSEPKLERSGEALFAAAVRKRMRRHRLFRLARMPVTSVAAATLIAIGPTFRILGFSLSHFFDVTSPSALAFAPAAIAIALATHLCASLLLVRN
jgi:hypothetical protein